MIIPQWSAQKAQEADAALCANLAMLRDGFLDLLAALVLLVIALCSVVHAVVRLVFGFVGLALWALALLIAFLYWLRAWAVSRSSSSLHKES
jgi:hypothetical protein